MRLLIFLTLIAWLTAVSCSSHAGQSVTLAWTSVTNADVVGYKIYYGLASSNYTTVTNVGDVTNATISGLAEGFTYYFSATSLSASGLESDYSTEVSANFPCTNCPVLTTNFIYAYGRSVLVQTDKVYWLKFAWTNYYPGYSNIAFFRLLLESNNLWQFQVNGTMDKTGWSNTFGTMLSGRQPRLLMSNWPAYCVATNINTNYLNSTNPPLP